jgi:hypothetical protein
MTILKLSQFDESFDFGIDSVEDIDKVNTDLDKNKVKLLFKTLKSTYNVANPMVADLGRGEFKVRIKEFDLDDWKKENNLKTSKLKKGQGSLGKSGGDLAGADWEEVICAYYNMASKKVDLEKAKQLSGIEDSWKPKFDGFISVGDQIVASAWKSPRGVMKHYGSGSADLNKEWDDYFVKTTGRSAGGTTKTPKTDMYIGNEHISLKKKGGSQLMSGGQAEALATLFYAYQKVPDSIKTAEFDNAWKQLSSDIETKFIRVGGSKDKSITDIKREMKAGVVTEIHKQVSQALVDHDAMQTAIRNIFSSIEVRQSFVREAMTGESKFKDRLAIATHVLVFDPVLGKGSYKKIDNALITQLANSLEMQINFKKGGGGNPYSNLRGVIKESVDEAEQEMLAEGVNIFSTHTLNEGILGKISEKVKRFFALVIHKVWEKIKKILVQSYEFVTKLTGRQISIRKEPIVTFKL